MPKMNQDQAVNLHNIINSMGGPASYHPLEKAVQKRILEAFPEATQGEKVDEIREIEISIEEKSVLAEEFAKLFDSAKTTMERDTLIIIIGSIGPKFTEYTKKRFKVTTIKSAIPSEIEEDQVPEEVPETTEQASA